MFQKIPLISLKRKRFATFGMPLLNSVMPLKTEYGNSHVLLITDDRGFVSAITSYTGRVIAIDYRWGGFAGDLYVIKQSGDNGDVLEFTACYSNAGLARRSIVPFGFRRDQIVRCDFSAKQNVQRPIDGDEKVLSTGDNYALLQQRVDNSVWTVKNETGEVVTTYVEPLDLSVLPKIFFPAFDERPSRFVYFHLPGCVLRQTVIVDLKDAYVDGRSATSRRVVKLLPDPTAVDKYPLDIYLKSILFGNQSWLTSDLFIEANRLYWLETRKEIYAVNKAVAVWLLDFGDDETAAEAHWRRVEFANKVDLGYGSYKLIVNDQGEVLVVLSKQFDCIRNKYKTKPNDFDVKLCHRFKVPSLKYLASRIVVDSNPSLVKMKENERILHGISYASWVPSCPWMKNFSKQTSNEM